MYEMLDRIVQAYPGWSLIALFLLAYGVIESVQIGLKALGGAYRGNNKKGKDDEGDL